MEKYTVTIGDKSTRLLIDHKKQIDEYGSTVDDFDGGCHNYGGIRGYAIDRAVKKLFGGNAYWFGNYDMLYHGQVFRPNNDGNGSNSCTSCVTVNVEEGW